MFNSFKTVGRRFCSPGGLLMVPVGTTGSFRPGVSFFRAVGELMGCVESRELGRGAPHLPRFILLGSFSDTLLLVSILDIVYECHL